MLNKDLLAKNKNSKTLNNGPRNYITESNVLVFPFNIKSGCVDITRNGFSSEINDLGYYLKERVFTGKEAINIVWDGSTLLESSTSNSNRFKYSFQVGKYYYGKVLDSETSTEIDELPDNGNYKMEYITHSITIRFDFLSSNLINDNSEYDKNGNKSYALFVKEQDLRKVYIIDSIYGERLFRISSVKPIYESKNNKITGNVIANEVTFTTIGIELQNSGQANSQFIQFAAPGEPYAYPKIVYVNINNKQEKRVIVDSTKSSLGKQAHYCQIELLGTGTFSGAAILGRKLTYDSENDEIVSDVSKWLLPYEFYNSNDNKIDKISNLSTVLSFLPKAKLLIQTTEQDVETYKKFALNDLKYSKYSGLFLPGICNDWVDNKPKSNKHKSNINNLSYLDNKWLPNYQLQDNVVYNMNGSSYMSDIKYLWDDTFTNIFIKNSFYLINNPILPYNFQESKPFLLSDLPIIGSLARMLLSKKIGDRTLWEYTNGPQQEPYPTFISSDLLTSLVNTSLFQEEANKEVKCFLDSLGSKDDTLQAYGSQQFALSFMFQLTDTFRQNNTNYDTILIGQSKYENGSEIDNGNILRLYGGNELENTTTKNVNNSFDVVKNDCGYVIDKILIGSNFNGNVRITFYDENKNSIYQGIYNTNTKWLDGAFTNWTTDITLGTWPNEYVSPNYNPTWPEKDAISTNIQINQQYLGRFNHFYNAGLNDWQLANTFILANSEMLNGFDMYWWYNFLFSWGNNYDTRYWKQNIIESEYTHSSINSPCWFHKDFNTYTKTINYSDIDSSVNDRDSFITKYKQLEINLDNTSILYGNMESELIPPTQGTTPQDRSFLSRKNILLNNSNYTKPTINLTSGTYTYNKNCYVSINYTHPDNIFYTQANGLQLYKVKYKYSKIHSNMLGQEDITCYNNDNFYSFERLDGNKNNFIVCHFIRFDIQLNQSNMVITINNAETIGNYSITNDDIVSPTSSHNEATIVQPLIVSSMPVPTFPFGTYTINIDKCNYQIVTLINGIDLIKR